MVCTKEFLTFSSLDDKNFKLTVKVKKKNTNVVEKWISNKTLILNQTNLTARCKDNNITKYFHNEEIRDLLQPRKEKLYPKILHLNISTLPYHCLEPHRLLRRCRINFDITVITESTIRDKIFGTKWSNPVNWTRKEKNWYPFLRVF